MVLSNRKNKKVVAEHSSEINPDYHNKLHHTAQWVHTAQVNENFIFKNENICYNLIHRIKF